MRLDVIVNVSRELRDRVEQELEPGEKIQWIDTPIPRYFTSTSVSAFPFGIPWTAFSVFWTVMAAQGTSRAEGSPTLSIVFPLFGVSFILVGLGMLATPFWIRRKALRTVYAITDRRAISIEGGWSTTVCTYAPESLRNIYRKDRRDGSGDVILAREPRFHSHDIVEQGFLQVRDVREVERMLAATRQAMQ
jgi:hypothetical protein